MFSTVIVFITLAGEQTPFLLLYAKPGIYFSANLETYYIFK